MCDRTPVGFRGQVMRGILAGGVLLLLAGCGMSDYPEGWPGPASGWLSRKGGCPDLVGEYSPVNSELSWLLSANPDFHVAVRRWSEHYARIEQADDGSWLKITLQLSASGMDDYRTRMLKFNWEGSGLSLDRQIELKVGEDYACSGGWLKGLHFAQDNKVSGMQRKSLRFRRDQDGGMIAAAELEVDQSLSWADSRAIPLGSGTLTKWYRWPQRDPADADARRAMQGVDLRRYPWVNGGRRVPIRFTSFMLEPICVRFYDGDYGYPVSGPEEVRGRDDRRPPAPTCPASWGKFDLGEVFRKELNIPGETPRLYRIEWFVLGQDEGAPEVIRIRDVQSLPLMPENT